MSSKRSSSASAAIVGGSNDLLNSILILLPAKYLVRFKLVSKQWQSLISDPSFCRRHTLNRRHPESQPLFFLTNITSSKYIVYSPTIRRFFRFTFPLGLSKVRMLQSCKGLLLLQRTERGIEHYYVFNPTTMQQRELSPPIPTHSSVDNIYLMFDPSLSLHYRVVCFANNPTKKGKDKVLVYVYDSETREWKQLEGERDRIGSMLRCGIYFNSGIYILWSNYCLSRFDPDNNMMSNIGYPDPLLGCSRLGYTMESNGYLLRLLRNATRIDVWEMKENENKWRNKYQIHIYRSLAKSGVMKGWFNSMKLLGMIRGEEEKDSFLLLTLNQRFMIYKFHDDVFEVDHSTSHRQFQYNPHHFIHTLAPV